MASRHRSERARARELVILLLLGGLIAWFLLSWGVEGNPAGPALVESIGATLGLLIFVSVIGTVRRQSRRRQRARLARHPATATRQGTGANPNEPSPTEGPDVRLDRE